MSNPNDGYAKRKEMSVQGLACTFSLSNIDAYFLVEDERVSYKSKVVASGMMYRILGQNTDILVFVDTIPYIRNNAMSYDEVVRVEFENLDYKDLVIPFLKSFDLSTTTRLDSFNESKTSKSLK